MIFSNEFIKIIERIDESKLESEITFFFKELIEGADYKVNFELNFIGCEPDSHDMVSFITEKKLKRLYEETDKTKSYYTFLIESKNDTKFWEQRKTKIKIGRLINKLGDSINVEFTDKELEDFINAFKGFNALQRGTSNFEIIKGEDIKKYYLYTSYQNMKGHLGESCMRYKKCQDYFDIYTKNPDICSLLILKGDGEKIVGRALIWNTSEGFGYLDRVYSTNDSDIILFNAYARDYLGCKYSYDEIFSFSFKKFLELSIEPKIAHFEKYPYMDTFRFFYPDTGIFYTIPVSVKEDFIELTLTTGSLNVNEGEGDAAPEDDNNYDLSLFDGPILI